MPRFLKAILRLFTLVSWIVAAIWLIYAPGFEPLLAWLTGATALIGSFVGSDEMRPSTGSRVQGFTPGYGSVIQTQLNNKRNIPNRKKPVASAIMGIIVLIAICVEGGRYSYNSDFYPSNVEDISFPIGATSYEQSVDLEPSKPKGYRLWISEGQILTVTGAQIRIVVRSNDNNRLSPITQREGYLQVRIPETGNYVVAIRGSGKVDVKMTIPPL